jgi:hypothetical protein
VGQQVIKIQVESLKFGKRRELDRVDRVKAKGRDVLLFGYKLNGNQKAQREIGQRKEQRQSQGHIVRIVSSKVL